MNQGNNEAAEKVVNLRSLLIRILLRWKTIVFITILCCVLLISYGFLKANSNSSSNGTTEKKDYYDSVLESFDKALEDRYNYMANTIVGEMNPYGQVVTQTTYFIKDPQSTLLSNPNSSSQVNVEDYNTKMFLNALQQYLKYGINWNDIKKEFNIDDDVLVNELILSEINYDSINIFVYYSNVDDSQKLANYINSDIEKQFENLSKKTDISGYELIQLNYGTTNVIFGNNFNWLTNRINEINNIQTAKDNFIKTSASKGISSSNNISGISFKSLIKHGVFGAAIGFIISVACIGFYLVTRDKILSGKELNDYLGTINLLTLNKDNNGKRLDLISKRVLSVEPENKNTLTDAQRIKLSNDYINQIIDKKTKIGIISDISSMELDRVLSLLREDGNCPNYTPIYDVINNLEDRKKLKEVDSVVLLVKDEVTKYNNVNEIVSILEGYNKKIIGTISC